MHLERTGINEPAIVLNLLEEEGYRDIVQWNDPPESVYDWHSHPEKEIRWVIFGDLEIETEQGIFTLVSGDFVVLEGEEKHRARVGSSGAGYIMGIKR